MKNSGKQKDNEKKEKLKTQGEALRWLDGASRWYNRENLELRKKKDETIETENFDEPPE